MFKVTRDLKLKVQGVIKVFLVGSVINLPEKSAQMFVQQGKIVPVPEEPPKEVRPYVTDYGILVIPWNSARKYHYWNTGQSVCDTLKELGRCDLVSTYKSIYSN